ncbi:hypothetical protein LCGC14_2778900 [marine sediment metagenome]|uniref:Uncharacterized protein n=1 Tax=marine sediment metagenome TaxID=412755 RepID=A0A0F8ZFX6_9ZZZZ
MADYMGSIAVDNLRTPNFSTLIKCTGEEWRALLREDTQKEKSRQARAELEVSLLHEPQECAVPGCENIADSGQICWVCDERREG